MDPNEALKQLREKMAEMKSVIDDAPDYEPGEDVDRDAVLVEAVNRAVDLWDGLDHWLSMQGFLPDAWNIGRNRPVGDTCVTCGQKVPGAT